MKKYQLVVLIISIALLSMGATLSFYSFYKVKHIETISMDIKVGDTIGINLDPDAMHLGSVLNQGCSMRSITINHKYEYPVMVDISVIGDLETWTHISENDFSLNQGEQKEIFFEVCAPEGVTPYINYTGEARIMFRRI